MEYYILTLKYWLYNVIIFFLKFGVYIENKIEQYNHWRLERYVKAQITIEQMNYLINELKTHQ